MRTLLSLLVLCCLAAPVAAQDSARSETLADIRQELTVLNVEMQKLKRELSTTGAASGTSGSSLPDRVAAIEAALQDLTAKTEALQHRIEQVVADGTNRIGDLEFRLVELEGGDIGSLGETSTLGGGDAQPGAVPSPVQPSTPDSGTPDVALAVGERADFDAAVAAADAGDNQKAAELFGQFNEAYPGSPLAVDAYLRRGNALEAMGDHREGARAYLAAFTADQQGPRAAEALTLLGTSLGKLGQSRQACLTLGEVRVRFPGASAVTRAEAERVRLNCE
ncbi:tetratricopeptide repeat protein [Chachezhania antarctica]|uniref:tetratricopeptide repeat protein n=1 Tax=Chachezhania antarctica TaxID=2340860 RepID=UPI000EB4566F|nr:tetratricopeptide repeat protein [Chachezhania antarctica]